MGKVEKDLEGRNLCRWCRSPTASNKRTFCGPGCVHEWRLRSNPGYLAQEVYKRDVGVCAACGVDTAYVKDFFKWLIKMVNLEYSGFPNLTVYTDRHPTWPTGWKCVTDWARWYGLSLARVNVLMWRTNPFDVDHIIPLAEGGDHGIANTRTLCLGCHDDVSREGCRRRAVSKST